MKYAVEQPPHDAQVDNDAEAPGQSKSTSTSRAILVERQTLVESFESNIGSPPERLGPVFSFGSGLEISRLWKATAASTATAAMIAML